jgi:hypothetical protein
MNEDIAKDLPNIIKILIKSLETGDIYKLMVIILILVFVGFYFSKAIIRGIGVLYNDKFKSPEISTETKLSAKEHYVFSTIQAVKIGVNV